MGTALKNAWAKYLKFTSRFDNGSFLLKYFIDLRQIYGIPNVLPDYLYLHDVIDRPEKHQS